MKQKHGTREEYLQAATALCAAMFKRAGHELPPVKVSVGWPSRGALSANRKTLGQCWDKSAASDSVAQIYITPFLVDPVDNRKNDGFGVIPVLIHELVHAVLGTKEGHGKNFKKLALAVGLEGKMTSTHAGEKLVEEIRRMLPELGEFPHAKLDGTKSGIKKQTTRMVKAECGECGYILRTSQKWLEIAVPVCPCHPNLLMLVETK